MATSFIHQRKNARKFALQALYEWHIAGGDIQEVVLRYLHPAAMGIQLQPFDHPYFQDMVQEVAAHTEALESQVVAFIDRELDSITPIERVILWISTWELTSRLDIPYKVIVNEAIELAKIYGAAEAHKFINGVLDPLSAQLRPLEKS